MHGSLVILPHRATITTNQLQTTVIPSIENLMPIYNAPPFPLSPRKPHIFLTPSICLFGTFQISGII